MPFARRQLWTCRVARGTYWSHVVDCMELLALPCMSCDLISIGGTAFLLGVLS